MKLINLTTYAYSFLILIPFFIEMLKMKKSAAKILYFLITIAFCIVYGLQLDFNKVKLFQIITVGLEVAGGAALVFSAIKFKESHTQRRLEANVFLMLLATGFFVISNPAILAPALMAFVFFANYATMFPMMITKVANFKTKFFTTVYGIEEAKKRVAETDQLEREETYDLSTNE